MHKDGQFFLHVNVRSLISESMDKKLQNMDNEILQHPPYSSDISPTDQILFKHFDIFVSNKILLNGEDAIKAFEEFITAQD